MGKPDAARHQVRAHPPLGQPVGESIDAGDAGHTLVTRRHDHERSGSSIQGQMKGNQWTTMAEIGRRIEDGEKAPRYTVRLTASIDVPGKTLEEAMDRAAETLLSTLRGLEREDNPVERLIRTGWTIEVGEIYRP